MPPSPEVPVSSGTLIDRFLRSSDGFERILRTVRPDQWTGSTPCTEWDVRQLVNHMTRGNLSYVSLLRGGTAAEFIGLRDADALGVDPVGAFTHSVRVCAEAFGEPGALDRILDYPLGRVTGRQGLAVRTTDSTVHTWDLATAVGADERLDAGLVAWIDSRLEAIYARLPETPASAETTHRFFAAPRDAPAEGASRGERREEWRIRQDRLLRRMGRTPG